jgi:hypothetical protein
MTDTIVPKYTELCILAAQMDRALAVLQRIHQEEISNRKLIPIVRVKRILQSAGFRVVTQGDDLYINREIFAGELWIEDNEVLNQLIGVINPGSYATGFSDEGVYWQARYFYNSRKIEYGRIVFPDHPHQSFPNVIDTKELLS